MGKRIIAIDGAKLNTPQKTGVEKTLYYIVKHLLELDSEKTYRIYTASSLKDSGLKNYSERVVPGKRAWHRFYLPLALLKDKPEKLLSISNFISAFAPEKSVQLLHDFAYEMFPEAYSQKEKYLQEETVKIAQKRACCIIFTSEANRQDYVRFYGEPKCKSAVIPLAFDNQIYKPVAKPRNILDTTDYILFVGRLEEKKNVPNIIAAYNLFRDRSKSVSKLVLAGRPGYGSDRIKELIDQSKYAKDIIIPGYIREEDLPHIYANAKLLFFPSLYEGFGIPALEAMAVGIPVITSDIPTMREVAGDAAIFVNPQDIEEMAKKIDNLTERKELAASLTKKGFERASMFSWQKTAEQVDALMKEI